MKLLTICIPTYKRAKTLSRCIESVVSQIKKYSIDEHVSIYVANDASPDDTEIQISKYSSLEYFYVITRKTNLGMNLNIKSMLQETSTISKYQLIITDDDYLQDDALVDIVEHLKLQSNREFDAPIMWTPRFSYTESGDLHCVVCNPKDISFDIKPSIYNAGKYMMNCFVLSGLIIQAGCIDYELWNKYNTNAYFPVIFSGDLLLRKGGFYWNKNIVHHTVLNECHWGSWGENDVIIDLRLFTDFVNAYSVLASEIKLPFGSILFYIGSFKSIYRIVNGPLLSDKIRKNRKIASEIIQKQKSNGLIKFTPILNVIILISLVLNILLTGMKLSIYSILSIFSRNKETKSNYKNVVTNSLSTIKSSNIVIKLITPLSLYNI